MFAPQDTKCETCIFKEGYGCRLNKLQLYQSKNIEIFPTQTGNILRDFVCPYHRTHEWLGTNWYEEDLLAIIRKENALPYIPVLLFLHGAALERALKKICTFKTKPKEVFIILRKDTDKKIIDEVSKTLKDTGITWHVHFELEENSWHTIFKAYNRREFLLLIRGYPEIATSWTEAITRKIQDELVTFSYAENENQTMMLISPYIYNNFYFEFGKDFLIKLRQIGCKNKCML